MVLPFAEGRGGRSKKGKRQRDGDREGERGPRLFQLWTVLSRASLTDLKAALRQSSVAASCSGIWSEKKYLLRSTCWPYLSTWVKDVFSPTVKIFVISVQSSERPPNSIPTGVKIQSMSALGVSWEKWQTDQMQIDKLKKTRGFFVHYCVHVWRYANRGIAFHGSKSAETPCTDTEGTRYHSQRGDKDTSILRNCELWTNSFLTKSSLSNYFIIF